MPHEPILDKFYIESGTLEFQPDHIAINDNSKKDKIFYIGFGIYIILTTVLLFIKKWDMYILIFGIVYSIILGLIYRYRYIKRAIFNKINIENIKNVTISYDTFDRPRADFIMNNSKKRRVLLGFASSTLADFENVLSSKGIPFENTKNITRQMVK